MQQIKTANKFTNTKRSMKKWTKKEVMLVGSLLQTL